jgi:signal transduction histidine kinase
MRERYERPVEKTITPMSTATGVRTALDKRSQADGSEKRETMVIQTLAHELRQPLSAMESIAYYLDLVLDRGDQRARDHALRLHGLVEQSNWILSCALEMALDLAPKLEPGLNLDLSQNLSLLPNKDNHSLSPVLLDLTELITQSIAAHLLPGQAGPELNFADELPLVVLDPARGRVLIANLLALFERLAEHPHRACVNVAADAEACTVVLEIAAAVDCENPRELSPKELSWGAGGTMGLESMRRVAQAHSGDLTASADSVGGYRARLSLPASPRVSCST